MSIVVQKQLSSISSSIDGDMKYSVPYHEQRIPSFEVSLLSPNNPDDVTGPTVHVIQSAAVVNVIASQTQNSSAGSGAHPNAFDRQDVVMSSPQSPGVVPTVRSVSSSRFDQKEINAYCGVVYQDHNYGAPMPFASASIPCPPQPPSFPIMENDDLPAKLVPLTIAQPIRLIDSSVASVAVQNSCPDQQVQVVQIIPTPQPPEKVAPPKLTKKQKEIASHDSCRHYDAGEFEKPKTGGTRCICGFLHDDGYMIQCECCTTWQHVACFGLSRESMKKSYFCEICDPREVNRSRAISIQERRVKRVKSQKKEVAKKSEEKKNGSVERKKPSVKITPQPARSQSVSQQKTATAAPPQSAVSLGSSSPGNVESTTPTAAISREERKLLAIMKQFEEMEKKTREKMEHSPPPEDAVVLKKTVNDTRQPSPALAVNKPQKQNSKTKKAKVSPTRKTPKFQKKNEGRRGLATMLKKRSKTAVKKLQNKIRGRQSATKKRNNITSSTVSSTSDESEHNRLKGRPKKSVVSNASNSVSLPGSGKKRWLVSVEPDEKLFDPLQAIFSPPAVTPYDSHPFLDTRISESSMVEPTFNTFKGFPLFSNPAFDSRICDTAPVAVASPPGSPEPVLAPLKKRYARTESASTPIAEAAPVTIAVAPQPRESTATSFVSDVVVPPQPPCQSLPTSPAVPLNPIVAPFDSNQSQQFGSITECKVETAEVLEKQPQLPCPEAVDQFQQQFSVEIAQSCPLTEPPAKRKVSLKEYKQRIRENEANSATTVQLKTAFEVNGITETITRNCESGLPSAAVVPVNSDAAVLPSSVMPSERLMESAVLLDVDNDDDDILVAPLPQADFNLSGGYVHQQTVESNATPNVDPLARSDSASKGGHNTQPHSRRRPHRQHKLAAGSDLRVIIPTKAERVAKLNRVDRWLDDVIKKNEDSNEAGSTTDESDADAVAGSTGAANDSENSSHCQPQPLPDQSGNLVTSEKEMMETNEDAAPLVSTVPNTLATTTLTTNTTISTTASVDDGSHSSAPHSPQHVGTAAKNASNSVTDE